MNGFVHIRKAHCMFGWDWGAHLPDAGIWRAVQLLGVDTAYLESVEVLQYHEKDKVTLDIRPEIIVVSEKNVSENMYNQITAKDPCGNVLVCQKGCDSEIVIEHPDLWWPHGYGEQNLYTISVNLIKEDGIVIDNWTKK